MYLVSESANFSDFSRHILLKQLIPPPWPPKLYSKPSNSVEKEGKLLLAISTLKKRKSPISVKQRAFMMYHTLLSKTTSEERQIGRRLIQIAIRWPKMKRNHSSNGYYPLINMELLPIMLISKKWPTFYSLRRVDPPQQLLEINGSITLSNTMIA